MRFLPLGYIHLSWKNLLQLRLNASIAKYLYTIVEKSILFNDLEEIP